jgi:hypothetical protein
LTLPYVDTLKSREHQSKERKKDLNVKRGYVDTTVRVSVVESNKRQKKR